MVAFDVCSFGGLTSRLREITLRRQVMSSLSFKHRQASKQF